VKHVLKLAQPALAVLMLGVATPASAQVAGTDAFQQMERFAPVLEIVKQRMGKERFGRLMQTVGPMVDPLLTGQGTGTGSYGALGGPGFDAGRLATLVDGQTIAGLVQAFGPAERPRRAVRKQMRQARR
jgi:hypothetical protein